MEKTNDSLRDKWANLGIAFVAQSKIKNADPELTLLESLKYLHEDRKLLKLIITWLNEFGDLLHTERVKSLGKNLTALEHAWLGVLADYMVQSRGDIRFKSLRDLMQKHLGQTPPWFEQTKLQELQYEKELSKGSHPAGANFGLRITQSDLIGDSKKLLDKNITLKGNLWLRMRLLFGCTWRADMCTVILLELACNYYQARKVLGCSIETAHRNWNALKEVNVREILKI